MKLTSDKEDDFLVLAMEGDLDASSSIIMDEAMSKALKAGEKKIIVDCARLNYISSAGLGVFMSYLQDFENNEISMVLCNVSEKVLNVFRILGLDSLLQISSTKEEAKKVLL